MGYDFIPRPDTDFDAWVAQFVGYATANMVDLDLSPVEIAELGAAHVAWQSSLETFIAARAAQKSALQAKLANRQSLESVLRRLARQMRANPAVTLAEGLQLRIGRADSIRTPSPTPSTHPLLRIDTSQRLRHAVAFVDEATPTSKAKPRRVKGCEIFVKVGGDPPLSLVDCRYLATATRTPFHAEFDGNNAGMTAHYIGRWVNSRGIVGPISATASATIVG